MWSMRRSLDANRPARARSRSAAGGLSAIAMGSRAAVLQVRIHLPPGESPRTIGPARRMTSKKPQPFMSASIRSVTAHTRASRRSGEYPAAFRSKSEVNFVIWSSSCGNVPTWCIRPQPALSRCDDTSADKTDPRVVGQGRPRRCGDARFDLRTWRQGFSNGSSANTRAPASADKS